MYKFTYRNNTKDFWQMSMYYTYGSIVGVCNVIFTAAMAALIVAFWKNAGVTFRLIMILGCCLFTIIQPLSVWLNARKQAATIKQDTILSFDEKGMHVMMDNKSQDIGWKNVSRIIKKPTMIMIYSDATHGYVLNNQVLGKERKEFLDDITKRWIAHRSEISDRNIVC